MSDTGLSGVPWIEKYRPNSIDDLLLDSVTLSKIKKIIQDKDMPNIIIPGLPGIGKTSTIKCIARSLYGPHIDDAVLEINASDDRGIKSVQENIVNFCKKKMYFNEEDSDDDEETKKEKAKYAKHKIIFLDEADNMTEPAQRLVNMLMEKNHGTTRFAITCNESSDIIESIQSRCIIMRFYKLTTEQITSRLKHICECEKIKYNMKTLEAISVMSNGDLRSSINTLQLVFNGFGEVKDDSHIYDICGKPQPVLISELLYSCIQKNFRESIKKIIEMKKMGFSESDILVSMFTFLKLNACITVSSDKTKTEFKIKEDVKIKLLDNICHSIYIVSKGVNTELQLTGCISSCIIDLE